MRFSVKKYLSQKIRFAASKYHTDEELWHINATRFSIVFWSIIFLIAIITLIIFFTLRSPLANYIPGFHGKKSQEKLVVALHKLDSLTDEVNRWEKYNDNLTLVLEGGSSVSEVVDSISNKNRKVAPRIILDSIFRERIRKDSIYHNKGTRNHVKGTFELLPPSIGMITDRFNPANGNNGIIIAPPPSGTILSIMDGTIINSSWSPTEGYTIIIQHAGGLISIYRNVESSLHNLGQHVSAGEAIGVAFSIESGITPKLVFELWLNGNVVDPENYIKF